MRYTHPSPTLRGRAIAYAVCMMATLSMLTAQMAGATPVTSTTATPRARHSAEIVGGVQAATNRYPFMAALLERTEQGPKPFCGGTLVAPSIVMTAAHCVANLQRGPIQISVGRTDLSNPRQGQLRSVNPSRFVLHPRYFARTYAFDLALIDLGSPVKRISPVRLAALTRRLVDRSKGTAVVIGWGVTTEGNERVPDRLREVTVPLKGNAACTKGYSDDFKAGRNICAGTVNRDSCQGDSGGPLLTAPTKGTWVQIGIVSFGDGCGRAGKPGVYTAVESSLLWTTLGESPQGRRMLTLLSQRRSLTPTPGEGPLRPATG
ncbi:S1 family serine peptidase [Streptomyces noursei]|uniref:S1 family serine peptidase n=1 Tax=Streptomyces noursei TaxID=1971 RepID=UPI00340F6881